MLILKVQRHHEGSGALQNEAEEPVMRTQGNLDVE